MSAEEWIDDVARLWAFEGHSGLMVKSYLQDEFPESINYFPCAISYIAGLDPSYSIAGPLDDLYWGVTEFHLFPSASKAFMPEVNRYYAKIRNAAASRMTLGGKVARFELRRTSGPPISRAFELTYGIENPHLGLLVMWEVKEIVVGDYTPAA